MWKFWFPEYRRLDCIAGESEPPVTIGKGEDCEIWINALTFYTFAKSTLVFWLVQYNVIDGVLEFPEFGRVVRRNMVLMIVTT